MLNFKTAGLAISAAALAGTAYGQTSVILYGLVDEGLQIADSPNGTVTRISSGIQSGTRWGMRGTEVLDSLDIFKACTSEGGCDRSRASIFVWIEDVASVAELSG